MGERFKLSEDQIAEIRRSDLSDSVLARRFGVKRVSIWQARVGRTYKNFPIPPQPLGRVQKSKGFAVTGSASAAAAGRIGGRNRAGWRAL